MHRSRIEIVGPRSCCSSAALQIGCIQSAVDTPLLESKTIGTSLTLKGDTYLQRGLTRPERVNNSRARQADKQRNIQLEPKVSIWGTRAAITVIHDEGAHEKRVTKEEGDKSATDVSGTRAHLHSGKCSRIF